MVVLIKLLQVVLALSILVLVHELGHFLFARLFKIRVDKFYLFFNPWFSLFKFKPKNSDTEYGIGWLPLGGYCKIAGMIDESMDKEALKKEPQPWEYRAHPAWQRLFVIAGGVFFNLLSLLQGNGLHPYRVFFAGGTSTWALLYLGIGCSFTAYLIFNYILSRLKAELASCIQTNSITAVGVAAGIIWGGDSWGWYTVAGMLMTIAGIIIASRDVK